MFFKDQTLSKKYLSKEFYIHKEFILSNDFLFIYLAFFYLQLFQRLANNLPCLDFIAGIKIERFCFGNLVNRKFSDPKTASIPRLLYE